MGSNVKLTPDERVENFWKGVRTTNDESCWEWTRSTNSQGYGRYWDGQHEIMAHRFSYICTYGDFDRSLQVCHRCDNPSCVRPSHLFLGTASDNMQDMHRKGRNGNPVGSSHPQAKLSEDDVRTIRLALEKGETGISLAKRYKVDPNQISRIKHNKRWRHV